MKDFLKKNWILCSYGLMIFISFIILALCLAKPGDYDTNDGQILLFNDSWVDEQHEKIDLAHLNKNKEFKNDTFYSVYSIIPESLEGDSLLTFRTYYLSFYVYVDSEIIYEYGMEKNYTFGNSPGSAFHSIDIDEDDIGKKIEISFKTSYNETYERISDIKIGEGSYLLKTDISARFFGFISCVILFTLGVIYVVIDIPLGRIDKGNHSLLYLGVFAIEFCVWSLLETHIMDYFLEIPQVISVFDFYTLSLLSIPILLFVKDNFPIRNKYVFNTVIAISIFSFVLNVFFYFTKILDFNQSILITQVVIILSMGYIIYIFIETIIKEKVRFYNRVGIIIGVFILAICIILDLLFSKVFVMTDNSTCTRIGLIIFVILFGILTAIRLLGRLKDTYRLELVSQLAYHDGLTGIGNRTAFSEKIVEYEEKQSDEERIIIVMFDVNNLKKTNDLFGHYEGDRLLKAAADAISFGFSDIGDAYRIGGDEFSCIVADAQNKNVKDAINKMNDRIKYINKDDNLKFALSIAVGYSDESPLVNSLQELINQADTMMYENKRKMKAKG